MTNMRAKFVLTSVEKFATGEKLEFHAVAKSTAYPEDGSDEDNSYARYSPSASCEIFVANPDLFGKFEVGVKYYVDFTPA